jgi:hypothetical protein
MIFPRDSVKASAIYKIKNIYKECKLCISYSVLFGGGLLGWALSLWLLSRALGSWFGWSSFDWRLSSNFLWGSSFLWGNSLLRSNSLLGSNSFLGSNFLRSNFLRSNSFLRGSSLDWSGLLGNLLDWSWGRALSLVASSLFSVLSDHSYYLKNVDLNSILTNLKFYWTSKHQKSLICLKLIVS